MADEKGMRVTEHNGRRGKNGVYRAAHLDEDGTQIEKYAINFVDKDVTLEEGEKMFYDSLLEPGLRAQNKKHKARRQPSRCMTMDEYRKSTKYCPEETLEYIGNRDDTQAGRVSGDLLLKIALEQCEWERSEFPQVEYTGLALHLEEGAWHVHKRRVWLAHDEDGNLVVSQGGALEEMHVPRKDEEKYKADMDAAMQIEDEKERKKAIKQINRYNNSKITYTDRCREHFQQLCKEHGLEIITEPRERGKSGRSQAAYINEQLREERDQLQKDVDTLTEKVTSLTNTIANMNEELEMQLNAAVQSGYTQGWNAHVAKMEEEHPSFKVLAEAEKKKSEGEAEKKKSDAEKEGEKIVNDLYSRNGLSMPSGR